MRNSSTHCPHLNPLNFGFPQTRPDEKLVFVEHVLGVLIDSRFGNSNPYKRLGDQPTRTDHLQLFANVKLLTEAEIDAHLQLPLALANGAWLPDRSHFSPKAVWAKAREIVLARNRRLKPTAIPFGRADSSFLLPTSPSRGSPTFRGRSS